MQRLDDGTYEIAHGNRGETIEVTEIAYHRNGVGGIGFFAVAFTARPAGEHERQMVGVVFPYHEPSADDPESLDTLWNPTDGYRNPPTAVFDRELLGSGVVAFGANSFRGDNYDAALRDAIERSQS